MFCFKKPTEFPDKAFNKYTRLTCEDSDQLGEGPLKHMKERFLTHNCNFKLQNLKLRRRRRQQTQKYPASNLPKWLFLGQSASRSLLFQTHYRSLGERASRRGTLALLLTDWEELLVLGPAKCSFSVGWIIFGYLFMINRSTWGMRVYI